MAVAHDLECRICRRLSSLATGVSSSLIKTLREVFANARYQVVNGSVNWICLKRLKKRCQSRRQGQGRGWHFVSVFEIRLFSENNE